MQYPPVNHPGGDLPLTCASVPPSPGRQAESARAVLADQMREEVSPTRRDPRSAQGRGQIRRKIDPPGTNLRRLLRRGRGAREISAALPLQASQWRGLDRKSVV